MKTHFCSAITCAMKNLKGTTTYDEKKRFHYLGLNQAVAELNQVLKPHLHVVDASIAMEGDGPIAGTPVGLNVLMAGIDAVAVDTVAAQIMGINTDEVPIFPTRGTLGMESGTRSESRSLADPSMKSAGPLSAPAGNQDRFEQHPDCRRRGLSFMPGRAADCRGAPPGRRRSPRSTPPGGDPIGSKAPLPESPAYLLIPVGNCQNQYKHLPNYIPGCPPPTFLIADQIRELMGQPRKFGPREDFFMDK